MKRFAASRPRKLFDSANDVLLYSTQKRFYSRRHEAFPIQRTAFYSRRAGKKRSGVRRLSEMGPQPGIRSIHYMLYFNSLVGGATPLPLPLPPPLQHFLQHRINGNILLLLHVATPSNQVEVGENIVKCRVVDGTPYSASSGYVSLHPHSHDSPVRGQLYARVLL